MNVVQELVTVLKYKIENSEQLRTFAHAYNNVNTKINDTADNIRRSARAQTVFNQKQREAVHGANALASAYGRIKAIALGYMSLAGVGEFSRLADEMTKVHSRIRLFAEEGQEQNVYRGLFRNAQASGTSIDSAAELYATFGATRSKTGLDDRQMVKLTDIIGKAVAVSGGGVAGQRALAQFTQAIAKGKLRYEDLKFLEGNSPEFAKLIAEAAGTDIAGLQTRKGGTPIEEILQGFLKQQDKIDKLFLKSGRTFGMGLTRISNKFKHLVGQFNKITHLSQTFYRLSGWIADNLGVIVSLLGYAGATGAMRWLRASTGAWAGQIRKIGPLLRTALWPMLRMALLFEGLWLVLEDIIFWVHGGKSIIGSWFGGFDEAKKTFKPIADALEKFVTFLGGNSDALGDWTVKLFMLASAVMVVAYALSFLGKILWFVGKGLFRLGALLIPLLIANPLAAAIVAGIGLVVAAVWFLAAHWDKVCAFFKKAWASVCNALQSAWDAVCHAFKVSWDWVKSKIESAWGKLKKTLIDGWGAVKDAALGVWDAITGRINSAINAVKEFFGLSDDGDNVFKRHEKQGGKKSFKEDQDAIRKRKEQLAKLANLSKSTNNFRDPVFAGRTPYSSVRNNSNITINTQVHAANNPQAVADKVNTVVKDNVGRYPVWEATRKLYGLPPVEVAP